MSNSTILKTNNICKSFSGVKVLKSVDFEIRAGEVHALVGENGAGKSTLSRIICGVLDSTEGEIYLDNKKTVINSPKTARDLGLILIHQEPLIFPDLNIAENIYVGHMRSGKRRTFMDWKNKYDGAEKMLDSLGINLNINDKVKGLSIAEQQMVEIASALSLNSRIIFMDEPTASLTRTEVDNLFQIISLLRKQGKSIVYISHRLEEVKEISDRVTVIRDGEIVGTYNNDDISKEEIIKKMIGREAKELYKKEKVTISENPYFQVKNISLKGVFNNISFDIREGEILGIAGLIGAGRTELARALFGITPISKGEIIINKKQVKINSAINAIENGIILVPEDRQGLGLFMPLSVSVNSTFSVPKLITKLGVLNSTKENDITKKFVEELQIKLRTMKQPVRELSGGNQQKVSIAKWLATNPKILILDEPTRGIDVGAKSEVHKIINQLAKEGKCIIMISSELAEIVSLSDKLIVMFEGHITAKLDRDEITEEKITSAAAGIGFKLKRKDVHE